MRTNLKRPDFILLQHLQATWRRAHRANLDPRLAVEREKRCFLIFCQVDPTNGLYHEWLAAWRRRLWDERGFGAPIQGWDLLQLNEALERFHRLRPDLAPDRRDVMLYKSVDDLKAVIPTRIVMNQRRLEKDALKSQALADSVFRFRDKAWMIVSLRSYHAARFWGLGTRWCTTTSEATYENYARDGELVVFGTPSGKFQLSTGKQIFRDESDGPVDPSAFRNAPKEFRSLLEEYRRAIGDRAV